MSEKGLKNKDIRVVAFRRLFNVMIAAATSIAFGSIGWTIGIFIRLATGYIAAEYLITVVFGVIGALIGARVVATSSS